MEIRDLGDIRVAYSTQLYDLNGITSQPTYALFGAWEQDEQLGFITTTRNHQNHTHIHIETEPRDGRDIETALTDRIQEAIEQSRAHEATNARDREPAPLEVVNPTPADPAAIGPPERDPYIERAIQEARDRQQSWEHGIDPDRDNNHDLGVSD